MFSQEAGQKQCRIWPHLSLISSHLSNCRHDIKVPIYTDSFNSSFREKRLTVVPNVGRGLPTEMASSNTQSSTGVQRKSLPQKVRPLLRRGLEHSPLPIIQPLAQMLPIIAKPKSLHQSMEVHLPSANQVSLSKDKYLPLPLRPMEIQCLL